jgi:hypothetical protein
MKIWQFNTLPIDGFRQSCIDQFKANIPKEYEYEIILKNIEKDIDKRKFSDIFRYRLLSDHPNDAWFDTDVKIKEWWEPERSGHIYVNESFSIIFSNGMREVFDEIIVEYEKLKTPILGYIYHYYKAHRGYFKFIKGGAFRHYNLGTIPQKTKWLVFGNNRYSFRNGGNGKLILDRDILFPEGETA